MFFITEPQLITSKPQLPLVHDHVRTPYDTITIGATSLAGAAAAFGPDGLPVVPDAAIETAAAATDDHDDNQSLLLAQMARHLEGLSECRERAPTIHLQLPGLRLGVSSSLPPPNIITR